MAREQDRRPRSEPPNISTFQVIECENNGWCILMPDGNGDIRVWQFADPVALGVHIGALLGAPATISRDKA